jgi:hypothetical protein
MTKMHDNDPHGTFVCARLLAELRAGDDAALKDEVLELVAGWLQYGGDDLGRLCRNLREAIALPRARDDPGATPVAATPVGGQN